MVGRGMPAQVPESSFPEEQRTDFRTQKNTGEQYRGQAGRASGHLRGRILTKQGMQESLLQALGAENARVVLTGFRRSQQVWEHGHARMQLPPQLQNILREIQWNFFVHDTPQLYI
jgi:hypothetical protein